MKKLVLVATMFVFVCSSSLLAMDQEPVKTQPATEQTENKEEVTATPAQEAPVATEEAPAPVQDAPTQEAPASETPAQAAE